MTATVEPKKRGALSKVGMALAAASVLGGIWYLRRPDPPIEVEIVKVERGEVREMVTSAASGEVKPARRVTVRAELAGTVAAVNKKRGERVASGEMIVAFTSDEIDARLAQADANVEAAAVAVKAAQIRLQTAKRSLERAKKLRASDAISEVELDRVETEATALDQTVEQARVAEKQAIAAKRVAEVAKKRVSVHAPFAGVLQDVFAEVGVQMAPGAALFDLIDDSSVRVEVPVDESDLSKIHVGQKVTLKSDSYPGKLLDGAVAFIPPAVGRSNELGPLESPLASQKERSLRVEVALDDPGSLRVGASVNAEFLVSAHPDVLFVPSYAVVGRGVDRSVFVVRRGVAKKVPFKAGLTSWERTEVLSGLALGDELVAKLGTKGLDDGTPVTPK